MALLLSLNCLFDSTLLYLVVEVTHRPRDIRSFTINLNPNLPIGIRKLNYDQEESSIKVTRKISN